MSATATINLRIPERERSLIDQAAQVLGKTRTAFILEQSIAKAEEIMLNRTHFSLSESEWDAMKEALDAPLSNDQQMKLQKLFAVATPWLVD